jgi:hypothetical protein
MIEPNFELPSDEYTITFHGQGARMMKMVFHLWLSRGKVYDSWCRYAKKMGVEVMDGDESVEDLKRWFECE